MQRLRNFPLAGAFQRNRDAASAPEEKRAAQAKALWPDNKAIVPEPAVREPAPKKSVKSEKSQKRAAQKAARAEHKSLHLPPAPPLDSMPPFGTLAAHPVPEPPLVIAPRFSPGAEADAAPMSAPEPEPDTAPAPAPAADVEDTMLLLTEPLSITPYFLSTPMAEADTQQDDCKPLSIQPHIMGKVPEAAGAPAGHMQADEKLITALTQALQENLGTVREVRNQLAQQAVELALAAARSIAGHAIASDSLQLLRARLPELLAPQEDAPPLQISVCPEDEQAARALVFSLAQAQGYRGQIVMEADPRLERGDAVVNWRHYAWRALAAERRATVEASVSRYLAQLQESQLPTTPSGKDNPHG